MMTIKSEWCFYTLKQLKALKDTGQTEGTGNAVNRKATEAWNSDFNKTVIDITHKTFCVVYPIVKTK